MRKSDHVSSRIANSLMKLFAMSHAKSNFMLKDTSEKRRLPVLPPWNVVVFCNQAVLASRLVVNVMLCNGHDQYSCR